MDFIKRAKEIVSKHNLQKFVDILLDYWAENPPTLGHGFSHVVKVAVDSYELGKENDYEQLKDLFVGALFHDIHRPAEGAGGEEDQTKGAEIVKELFNKNKIDESLTKKVIEMINSHDDWRGEPNPPQYELIISVADKMNLTTLMSDAYVWASNEFAKKKLGKPIMTSHLQNTYLFIKYQQRAWEIFYKHYNDLKGMDRAIDNYINTTDDSFKKLKDDPQNKHFFEYFESQAEKARKEETDFLETLASDKTKIQAIMKNCY